MSFQYNKYIISISRDSAIFKVKNQLFTTILSTNIAKFADDIAIVSCDKNTATASMTRKLSNNMD